MNSRPKSVRKKTTQKKHKRHKISLKFVLFDTKSSKVIVKVHKIEVLNFIMFSLANKKDLICFLPLTKFTFVV